MNKLKLLSLIKFKKYEKLKEEIIMSGDDKKYNVFIRAYILELLCFNINNSKYNEIKELLGCVSQYYVPYILDDLLESKTFLNEWFTDILLISNVHNATIGGKEKYINAFMNSIVSIDSIFNFYLSKFTNDKEKDIIKNSIADFLKKNPTKLSQMVERQKFYGTYIISAEDLEELATENEDYDAIYQLMKYSDINTDRLLNKLGKLKDKNDDAKKLFLKALNEYKPETLNDIPFGAYVNEVKQLNMTKFNRFGIIKDACEAIATYPENSQVNTQNNTSQNNTSDDNSSNDSKVEKFAIEELEPPKPRMLFSDKTGFVKPPRAYTKKPATPCEMGPNGLNHF